MTPARSTSSRAASGEPGPNTFGTSGPVFSRIVLAAATAPTSQPARVNGTHGAGATLPSGATIVGAVSVGAAVVGSNTPSVQYANVTAGFEVPAGVKYRYELDTGWPMRSPYTPVSEVRMSVPVCAISGVWWSASRTPLWVRKFSRFGICSRSLGTFGLSRVKWTLSNCR